MYLCSFLHYTSNIDLGDMIINPLYIHKLEVSEVLGLIQCPIINIISQTECLPLHVWCFSLYAIFFLLLKMRQIIALHLPKSFSKQEEIIKPFLGHQSCIRH